MTNIEEIWKDVPNYEGLYQVSNLGNVKSVRRNRLLTLKSNGKGYLCIQLWSNGFFETFKVHQLVAMAFLGHVRCGHKFVVNHKNFIRTDNRLENIEVVTARQNGNLKHISHSSIYTGVSLDKKKKMVRSY